MNLRTLALLLAMSVVMTDSRAQASESLMSDESMLPRWYYYGYNPNGHALLSESYQFGDIYTKNNKTYRLLNFERAFFDRSATLSDTGEGRPAFEPVGVATGHIGIRESDGRIFVDRDEYMALLAGNSYWSWEGNVDYLPYEQTDDGELIIYDFTKKAGDRFAPVGGHDDITVLSVETLNTRDGIARRVQKLSNGCIVVEGIGCVNSTGMWLCYLNPACSPCDKSHIMLFAYGNNFENPVFLQEDVEFLTGINPVILTPAHNKFYNLHGYRLAAKLQKGVYISDGKKYIK